MIRFLGGLVITIYSSLAWAQCTAPDGVRGQFQIDGNRLKLCDGTSWINEVARTSVGSGCSAIGNITWTGAELRYCVTGGSLWRVDSTAGTSCAGQPSGMIRFDDPSGELRVCNGTTWQMLANGADGDPCGAANPAVGAQCSDGSIFVGKFTHPGTDTNEYKYFVTKSGCSETPNGSDTVTCSGAIDTLTKKWDQGTLADTVAENIATSLATKALISGQVTTPAIANADRLAAKYCNDMTYGNKTGWFLPSKTEMAFLLCKAATTSAYDSAKPEENAGCDGNKVHTISGFNTAPYWTSSEWGLNAINQATTQSFQVGTQNIAGKNSSNMVRCMRRQL